MRVWLIILLFLSGNAYAQVIPGAQNFGLTCPGGGALCYPIPLAPAVYYNFMTGSIPQGVTFSRGSTGWYFNSSGFLTSAAAGTPRFDYASPGSATLYGLLIEPSRTNLLIQSRDLTQSSWIKANATVALDQTGIDNGASSASSMTATAVDATVCQALSLASTNSVFSVYMKRVTGSGTISISQDNGVTYTTTVLTGSWQRFPHAKQSVSNPIVCIKIATSGDKIAVDVAQFEVSTISTSPIVTTNTTVIRSADTVTSGTTWWNVNVGSYAMNWRQNNLFSDVRGLNSFNATTAFSYGYNNGNFTVSGNGHTATMAGLTFTAVNKAAINYGPNLFKEALNNTLFSNTFVPLTTKPNLLTFGGGPLWVQSFSYWNYSLTSAQLQAQTQ